MVATSRPPGWAGNTAGRRQPAIAFCTNKRECAGIESVGCFQGQIGNYEGEKNEEPLKIQGVARVPVSGFEPPTY